MASATSRKRRPRPVNHCPHCGIILPSPWQGRRTVTVFVVMLLLVAGVVGGRLIAPSDIQLVEERRHLQQDQARLRQAQQQLQTGRQRLEEERKQLAAAKPPESSRVVGDASTAPTTEPLPPATGDWPVAQGLREGFPLSLLQYSHLQGKPGRTASAWNSYGFPPGSL